MKNKKDFKGSRMLGTLRRFELKTDDPEAIDDLDRVIERKGLTRRDLGIILLYLGVRPGFGPEDFGIWKRNNPKYIQLRKEN